ncbi:MAG: hypothetical protein ACLQF4_04565 [Xanthobacteraceae bacterium]
MTFWDERPAGGSMVTRLEGRPLTRDEERRIAAQSTEDQLGSRSLGTARRLYDFESLVKFTALFVLGMLGGAVFIAVFML